MSTAINRDLPFVTLFLIAVSVLVYLYSGMGSNLDAVQGWFITLYPGSGLPEVRSGQVWRVFTPVFLHFHLLHIGFNGVAMWVLGSVLERRVGSAHVLVLVLVIGVGSNLAEYYSSGPWFGGLSGVVYGVLGYFWIQGHCNPRFGLRLHNQVIYVMLGWFVLCWVGIIPNVANWAHTAGLGLGMAAAWISCKLNIP